MTTSAVSNVLRSRYLNPAIAGPPVEPNLAANISGERSWWSNKNRLPNSFQKRPSGQYVSGGLQTWSTSKPRPVTATRTDFMAVRTKHQRNSATKPSGPWASTGSQ